MVKEIRVNCEIDTLIFDAVKLALNKPDIIIEGCYIGDYAVKIHGKNSFILDNVVIPSISDVQNDLNAKREPRFVIVEKDLVKEKISHYLATENVSIKIMK